MTGQYEHVGNKTNRIPWSMQKESEGERRRIHWNPLISFASRQLLVPSKNAQMCRIKVGSSSQHKELQTLSEKDRCCGVSLTAGCAHARMNWTKLGKGKELQCCSDKVNKADRLSVDLRKYFAQILWWSCCGRLFFFFLISLYLFPRVSMYKQNLSHSKT